MFAQFLPIAVIAYVVGIFLASLSVFYRSDVARGATSAVFVMAWLVHLGAIAQRWVVVGGLPLSSQGEYLLALGGAIMTLSWAAVFYFKTGNTMAAVAGVVVANLFACALLLKQR